MYTDFSLEAFDSAYHDLKGLDSFLGILAGVLGISCKVVGR